MKYVSPLLPGVSKRNGNMVASLVRECCPSWLKFPYGSLFALRLKTGVYKIPTEMPTYTSSFVTHIKWLRYCRKGPVTQYLSQPPVKGELSTNQCVPALGLHQLYMMHVHPINHTMALKSSFVHVFAYLLPALGAHSRVLCSHVLVSKTTLEHAD